MGPGKGTTRTLDIKGSHFPKMKIEKYVQQLRYHLIATWDTVPISCNQRGYRYDNAHMPLFTLSIKSDYAIPRRGDRDGASIMRHTTGGKERYCAKIMFSEVTIHTGRLKAR
ncbi:hypothetical protein AVEN_130718-1 [Araneus ventricosus]|uniref:Uncharacterized protein n=1 Tax=Araneus ventricosus TaxID=182803 RepID=A0A4Y2FB30_ARAVE|nr:hypothetical protein AVEN_130718-1 [Araneus ventricosus]